MNNFRTSIIYQIFKKMETKVTTIYNFVIIILVLFVISYVLNQVIINKKINNLNKNNIEQFENIRDLNKKKIYNLNNNSNNLLISRDELNKIYDYSKKLESYYNKLNLDKDFKQIDIQKTDKFYKKQFNHPSKIDNQINYYKKKKVDDYLTYFSKKFNEYNKRPKNNSPFIASSKSKVLFTTLKKLDSVKGGALLEKGNLTNVKEKNYSKLSSKISNYNKFPNRRDQIPSCFNCQRKYMVCNDSHVSPDFRYNNLLNNKDKKDKFQPLTYVKKEKIENNILDKKYEKDIEIKDIDTSLEVKKYKANKNELDNIINFNKRY